MLFRSAKFEDVSNGPEVVIKFKDSINDSISGVSQSTAAPAKEQAQSDDVKMSAAAKVAQYKDNKAGGENS